MNGLATIEFQDNQPIAHEYNYYKYILWVLNLVRNLIAYRVVIVTRKRFHEVISSPRPFSPGWHLSIGDYKIPLWGAYNLQLISAIPEKRVWGRDYP